MLQWGNRDTIAILISKESDGQNVLGQRFLGDKGYVEEDQIETPHKKPNKQELTADEEEENKKLSNQPIVVEHMIRLLIVFPVAAPKFRLSSSR